MTKTDIRRGAVRAATITASALAGNWLGARAHRSLTGEAAHGIVYRTIDAHGRRIQSVPVSANFYPALACALLGRPRWAYSFAAGFVASLVAGDALQDRLIASALERLPVPAGAGGGGPAPTPYSSIDARASDTGGGASGAGDPLTSPATSRGRAHATHGTPIARPSAGDVAVVVSHLRKTYGATVAVDDVSFEARRGEIFGLLGPNGAGKTTTLECLESLRRPDGGTMVVMGVDPVRDPRGLRNVLGVQLQTGSLPPDMEVGEAMHFFAAYRGVAPRHDLLERLGLGPHAGVQYRALSTGLQRRLALALALAHRPQVLFLDEPTAGLDVASRSELHDLVREARDEGAAIVLATHDMAEAEKLADRVAILLRGRIAATGTPRDLTAGGAGVTKVSVRTDEGLGAADVPPLPGVRERLMADDYAVFFTTDAGATVAGILGSIAARGDRLADLRVERPSLEERFLEITGGGAS